MRWGRGVWTLFGRLQKRGKRRVNLAIIERFEKKSKIDINLTFITYEVLASFAERWYPFLSMYVRMITCSRSRADHTISGPTR